MAFVTPPFYLYADTVVGIDLHPAWQHCRKVLVSDYFGLKPWSFSCQR